MGKGNEEADAQSVPPNGEGGLRMKALQVLGERVLIVLDQRKEVSDGGIIIPERGMEVSIWGKVIAVGEKAKDLVIGDEVYVPKTIGTHFNVGRAEYIVIEESRVLCKKE